MKRTTILSLAFISYQTLILCTQAVPTYLAFRSQGVNNPRHLIGTTGMINKDDMEHPYGMLSATFEYNKNFRAHQITDALFGETLQCGSLVISGSAVANRSGNDWLADYFFLPQDFKSNVTFHPSIRQYIVDFNWYLGLDEWCRGLYMAVYAPLVHMRSIINLDETIISRGVTNFNAGVFSPQPLTVGSISPNFQTYISGYTVGDIQQSLAGANISIAVQPLAKAIIAPTGRTKTRLADLRLLCGWNKFFRDTNRIGVYAHIAAPTGNRPKGTYVLEPVIGNGHSWEIGGGLNGSCLLWHNEQGSRNLTLQGDIAISHFFSARQKRTLDLQGKPFSRYMLAIKFQTTIDNNLEGGGVTPIAQFDNEISPLANLSTVHVRASTPFQVDAVGMLTYSIPHWNFDAGYNLWARSTEQVKKHDNTNICLELESWGLKGDASLFGFIPNGGGATLAVNYPVALSATQHNATIHTGLNGPTNVLNQNIDAPQPATADTNDVLLQYNTASNNTTTNQINTSIQPIFIAEKDLETCKGKTRGFTSSLFGNIQYYWNATPEWKPALSLGFKVEFDQMHNAGTNIVSPGLSSWNIWLKGMVAFE